MKNTSKVLILFFTIITATTSYALDGLTPVCTNGPLNIVIINKNVSQCGLHLAKDRYCMLDTYVSNRPIGGDMPCTDDGGLWENTTNSMSYEGRIPPQITIAYDTYHYTNSGGSQLPQLKFFYKEGHVSDNCADVFGPDVSCVISESGDEQHKTYTFTLSRAQ